MVNIDDMSTESIKKVLERREKEDKNKIKARVDGDGDICFSSDDGDFIVIYNRGIEELQGDLEEFLKDKSPDAYLELGFVAEQSIPDGYEVTFKKESLSQFINVRLERI